MVIGKVAQCFGDLGFAAVSLDHPGLQVVGYGGFSAPPTEVMKGIIQRSQEISLLLGGKEGDFRKWWLEEGIKYKFSHRLAEWAFGMVNQFPDFESITEAGKHHALTKIAFMNLKKIGGGGSSKKEEIFSHVRDNRDRLLEEIQIIQLDIIIGSVTYSSIWEELFGEVELIESGYNIWIFKWNNIKVVDFYHPSNRYPKVMNYCLLEKVVNSRAFRKL